MALRVREAFVESTRQICVIAVHVTPNNDGTESADIEFDLKHDDPARSIEPCWSIFNVSPAEKQYLLDLKSDWVNCTVRLEARSNYVGNVSICITQVQLGEIWIEPQQCRPTR